MKPELNRLGELALEKDPLVPRTEPDDIDDLLDTCATANFSALTFRAELVRLSQLTQLLTKFHNHWWSFLKTITSSPSTIAVRDSMARVDCLRWENSELHSSMEELEERRAAITRELEENDAELLSCRSAQEEYQATLAGYESNLPLLRSYLSSTEELSGCIMEEPSPNPGGNVTRQAGYVAIRESGRTLGLVGNNDLYENRATLRRDILRNVNDQHFRCPFDVEAKVVKILGDLRPV
ncbi:hypothetical protein ACLOJK_023048 [Asimina triloba]